MSQRLRPSGPCPFNGHRIKLSATAAFRVDPALIPRMPNRRRKGIRTCLPLAKPAAAFCEPERPVYSAGSKARSRQTPCKHLRRPVWTEKFRRDNSCFSVPFPNPTMPGGVLFSWLNFERCQTIARNAADTDPAGVAYIVLSG